MRPSGCNVMEHEAKMYIRRLLRERRGRLGRVRRLADSSAKRAAVSEVTDRASAAVHRFVEFALKVRQRRRRCTGVCVLCVCVCVGWALLLALGFVFKF